MASKMDAFFDRGMKDLYASHDSAPRGLPDCIPQNPMPSAALVSFDQAPTREGTLSFQINDYQCIRALGQKTQARRWAWNFGVGKREDHARRNAMPGHLFFDGVDERMEIILGKMKAIIDGL